MEKFQIVANDVLGKTFSLTKRGILGEKIVSGNKNSIVVFLKFINLNAFIYVVSNLSSINFFIEKNVLSFGLIVAFFWIFLTFYLVLVFLVFIVDQLFFIFVTNVDVVWLIVGPISIVLNVVPYNASRGDCFKFSLYDLLIAICAVGNNSIYLCLLSPANNLK